MCGLIYQSSVIAIELFLLFLYYFCYFYIIFIFSQRKQLEVGTLSTWHLALGTTFKVGTLRSEEQIQTKLWSWPRSNDLTNQKTKTMNMQIRASQIINYQTRKLISMSPDVILSMQIADILCLLYCIHVFAILYSFITFSAQMAS